GGIATLSRSTGAAAFVDVIGRVPPVVTCCAIAGEAIGADVCCGLARGFSGSLKLLGGSETSRRPMFSMGHLLAGSGAAMTLSLWSLRATHTTVYRRFFAHRMNCAGGDPSAPAARCLGIVRRCPSRRF